MTTIFLVRHGLTAQTGKTLYGRMPGISLDERGRAQAEDLVERFDGIRLAAIYSSPLERCLETVVPLALRRGLEVIPSAPLIEMDAGDWTNRSLAQLRRIKRWNAVIGSPSQFRFPGGESFAEAQARAIGEVTRIAGQHRRGTVVVMTHGDIVRMLVAHYAGAHLDLFQRTIVDTAGISVVTLDTSTARVLLVNDTGAGLRRFAKTGRRANVRG